MTPYVTSSDTYMRVQCSHYTDAIDLDIHTSKKIKTLWAPKVQADKLNLNYLSIFPTLTGCKETQCSDVDAPLAMNEHSLRDDELDAGLS